ncbi:hypothetical protein D1AOALGA4SA_2800 [Olavius algarvensis Delta 1 endosymbiont]|nr:hypothetical protein D1AOALGA4SA_2800 [Olavius algarvensis Delta 1 endosymbiont]
MMESLRSVFFKIDRIHSFDIRYSLFDIRFFKVFYPIRPLSFSRMPSLLLNWKS